MGVLIKDLANELNIDLKELNALINKLEIKIKKNPTYGAEIKETKDFINIFINLHNINFKAEPNKVIEFFKNNIKKTKNYKNLNESKLNKIISDIQLLLENPEKFKNKIEQQEFYSVFNSRENLEKLQKAKNKMNIQTNFPHLLKFNEKFEKQTNQTNTVELKNTKKININIKNLKNIKNLQNFEINLNNDIYVLTGNNGIGKSTLLAALGQLVNKNSLSQEFQGNMFDDSIIHYNLTDDNNSVTFFYKKFKKSTQTKRWQAYSENEEEINLEKLNGFIESGIEGERLNKFTKEQRQKILEEVEKLNIDLIIKEEKLTNYFKKITDKNYKFFIYKSKSVNKDVIIYEIENKYLPEFTLSTGEYFILQILHQLIKKINTSSPSLVILDEIELALNPKLQIKFLKFLKEEYCKQHNTTFLIATQSISFIDNVNKVSLMRNINGKVKIFNNFKGKIIKTYLGENKTVYDKMIIVEDILAKIFIENLIEDISSQYLFIIFPYGGKDQISKHFKEEQILSLFANNIMIIYDGDVERELIDKIKRNLKEKLEIDIIQNTIKEIEKEIKSITEEDKKNKALETFENIKEEYIIKGINTAFLPILNIEEYIINLIKEENFQFIEKIHSIIKNSTFFDIKDRLNFQNDKKIIFNNFVKELSKNSFNNEYEIKNKLVNIIINLNKENYQFNELKERIENFLQN